MSNSCSQNEAIVGSGMVKLTIYYLEKAMAALKWEQQYFPNRRPGEGSLHDNMAWPVVFWHYKFEAMEGAIIISSIIISHRKNIDYK